MKKMLMGLFLLSGMITFGQDVKTTKKYFEKNELDKAQQAIDAAVTKNLQRRKTISGSIKYIMQLLIANSLRNWYPMQEKRMGSYHKIC